MPTDNDAIILTVDQLLFKWTTYRRFKAYLVGVAVDNLGNVQVTEYPGQHQVIHRPFKDRPHLWDMGHDGYMLYNTTGGLPDIVAYSLMVVRDRLAARNAGEIIRAVKRSHQGEMAALKAVAARVPATEVALQVLVPAMGIVGGVLGELRDKVLDTLQGSKFFGPEQKRSPMIDDKVSGGICDAVFEFNLFDAAQDEDTQADISQTKKLLVESNAMLAV